MDCPRCKLSLGTQDYEGRHILFCQECWGCWVGADDLRNILSDETTKWSKGEKQTIFLTFMNKGDADRQGSEGKTIRCPTCDGPMSKKRVDPDCPVVIDRCDEHGYWLDTGEIKELQMFIESRK